MKAHDIEVGLQLPQLGNLALFRDLDEEELSQVSECLDLLRLGPGQTLFEQGQVADSVYIILKGSFDVVRNGPSGRRETVALVGAETVVGEMSLVLDVLRPAALIAREDSVLLRLRCEEFDAFMDAGSPIASKMLRAIAVMLYQRLCAVDATVVELLGEENPRLHEFSAFRQQLLVLWGV